VTTSLGQHQVEIQGNRESWERKPLLRAVYAGFYERIRAQIDPAIPGRIVEIGSGMGNLKTHLPSALSTDLFPHSWLDLVCDGYELPFREHRLSHLILFDVFHHLQAPMAFLREAKRVLVKGGRLIVFDPFISWCSYPVYGLLHHEPVAWRGVISRAEQLPRPRAYYAAQGNATRLFFGARSGGQAPNGWWVTYREGFAAFAYLLSGGFSKPASYPASLYPALARLDQCLSRWPRLFGARCLVVLRAEG
jgi:SAM-dependent methyltransferase